jgi:hypothetical protein
MYARSCYRKGLRLSVAAVAGVGLALVAAGCAAPRSAPTLQVRSGPPANLALPGSVQQNVLAARIEREALWPAVDLGYRFDDVSSYAEVLFDNQFGFDRFGGTFRSGQNFRSGVLVR